MALVDVPRAYFYAPARRRAFAELPPEDYQAGDEQMCGLWQYSLYGTLDAAQNWVEELTSTLSDLKLTRGIACPWCVARLQSRTNTFRGNRARGRHHDRWRMIGCGIPHQNEIKKVRNQEARNWRRPRP